MKKIGIITFHNSYNCGSMLESYAIQHWLNKNGYNAEIIDYASEGQKNLYAVFEKHLSLRSIVKNLILMPHYRRLKNNNKEYEKFKNTFYKKSKPISSRTELESTNYDILVAGSDQIWNTTIADFDYAYYLDFSKTAKKIAYAPSFGARDPKVYCDKEQFDKLASLLGDFDYYSIREKNGQKWLKEEFNIDAEVLLDPTLLLDVSDYKELESDYSKYENRKYIFFYCTIFNSKVYKLVKQISKKYNLDVITWNAKSYYKWGAGRFGFELVDFETPSLYLKLIKDAQLVITTSFHGTIFSTLYEKKFFTIKNGDMFGDDDRVKTLVDFLGLQDRLIEMDFDDNFDYLQDIDFTEEKEKIKPLQAKSERFLRNALGELSETRK